MKLVKYLALLCTPIAIFSCGGNHSYRDYTVTFDLNGGKADFPTVFTIGEGQCIHNPGEPKHESSEEKRFTFKYWSYNDARFDFSTPIMEDITLKAEWNEIERVYHMVSFDTDGGEPTIDPIKVEDGFTLEEPTTIPVKTKSQEYTYVFEEWQLNGTKFDFTNTPITTDGITLKAKYRETKNKYTITFDSDSGSKVNPQTIEYGGYAKEPDPKPTKPSIHDYNYELEYWMDPNGSKFEFTTTQITDHITLKAKWKPIARVYHNVSFDTDGGTPAINPVEVEDGHTMSEPKTVPTKAATAQYTYTFKEWQLNGTKFEFAKTPITTDGITLKAKYDETINKYTVSFDTGTGGSVIKSQTVEYGKYATKPTTDPTRQDDLYNYTFIRWEDKDGNEFNFEGTAIVGNTTVYAKWSDGVNWWLDDTYISGLTEEDVGITRGVTINNKLHKVRLIGVDHDNIASSNEKAHTTWEFDNLISDSSGAAMLSQWGKGHEGFTDDYINSVLRKTIDGGGTAENMGWKSGSNESVLDMLPVSLKNNMKTVTKNVNIYASSTVSMSSYNTKLFQLATLEMGYSSQYAESFTYAPTYKYYKNADEQTESIRIKTGLDKTAVDYWMRSPYTAVYASFALDRTWECEKTGKITSTYITLLPSSIVYGAVAPAFCL